MTEGLNDNLENCGEWSRRGPGEESHSICFVRRAFADVNYGDDSALYVSMGYVRKSARTSGLTRKSKAAAAKAAAK